MLSGWGGDELASFNGRGHLGLARRGMGDDPPSPIAKLAAARHERRGRMRAALRARSTGHDPLLPVTVETGEQRRTHPRIPRPPTPGSRSCAAIGRSAGATAWADARPSWPSSDSVISRFGLRPGRGPSDRSASRTCYPLLGRRVVELCLAFPEHPRLHEGFTRWVYRAAVPPTTTGRAHLGHTEARAGPPRAAGVRAL